MLKLSEYVMTAEAAEILGVSQNTLRSWAASGKVPVTRNPANGYTSSKGARGQSLQRKSPGSTPIETACGYLGVTGVSAVSWLPAVREYTYRKD